jgi:hypothetical protein
LFEDNVDKNVEEHVEGNVVDENVVEANDLENVVDGFLLKMH